MINSIQITNHLNETITMEMRSPELSGFLIQSIDGLAPPKATINTTDITGGDGSIYNSAKVSSRNIVFNLLFFGNSIEDIRQKSYKYFPIKKRVSIIIETDNRICQTIGYVESNDISIFSKDEFAIISIVCPDSYLYDTEMQVTPFSSLEATFEFPFKSESPNFIEMGNITIGAVKTINYLGDSPVGIEIRMNFTGLAEDIEITNTITGGSIFIDTTKLETMTGDPIGSGDQIFISTVKGNKYVNLIRDGVTFNIINAIGSDPEWFQLDRGDNLFAYDAVTGLDKIIFQISNRIAYEGI